MAACNEATPITPTPTPCTYAISVATLTFGPQGGPASVTLTTAGHCTWTTASNREWITVTSGGTGTGPGAVVIAVLSNASTTARDGTLTIAGLTVAVHQDGLPACVVSLPAIGAFFSHTAAVGSLTVSAPSYCSWSAVSDSSWLSIVSGSPGLGAGLITYALEANRRPETRTATIVIGGVAFRVDQAGEPAECTYSVSAVDFTPCMSGVELTAAVTTQNSCTWTAAIATPEASWITVVSGSTGSGPGTVRFRVADNWDAPRQGVVQVRWPTVTAGQNLRVQQAGCYYGVSTHTINVEAAGGTGRFDVVQQSDPIVCGGPLQNACLWSAVSNATWLVVSTNMPQTGDNPVSFTIAPNTSGQTRSGTIVVRDQVVTVWQPPLAP